MIQIYQFKFSVLLYGIADRSQDKLYWQYFLELYNNIYYQKINKNEDKKEGRWKNYFCG